MNNRFLATIILPILAVGAAWAQSGRLAWCLRAAPERRMLISDGRLESVWPVHGSVLVQDGVATLVAGRSNFLDGGLRMLRLDVATGRKLGETYNNTDFTIVDETDMVDVWRMFVFSKDKYRRAFDHGRLIDTRESSATTLRDPAATTGDG